MFSKYIYYYLFPAWVLQSLYIILYYIYILYIFPLSHTSVSQATAASGRPSTSSQIAIAPKRRFYLEFWASGRISSAICLNIRKFILFSICFFFELSIFHIYIYTLGLFTFLTFHVVYTLITHMFFDLFVSMR